MGIFDLINSPLNRRVAQGISSKVPASVKRGLTGVVEKVNPFDNESRGNRLVDKTGNRYQATPGFSDILNKVNPHVGGAPQATAGLQNVPAAGLFYPREGYSDRGSRLWVSDKSSPKVMMHEGLHAAWDDMPEDQRQEYLSILDRTLPPISRGASVRGYLQGRTQSYTDRQPMTDLTRLSPSMATEVHSYIPEYYETRGEFMPKEISNYYSKYYNIARPTQMTRTRWAINQAIQGYQPDPFSEEDY